MIFISRNFLSGTGDINIPMIMGMSEVISRVAFANILTAFIGVYGVWWATGLNWLITSLIGIIRVATGKWKTKSIIQSGS
jgi:Na+-driven multidrug efflux pump